ncbi:hypothetical protein IFM89_010109 [Coptis chinensis]|uniref:Pectinesterase n=1 Tax=Coptis chinensis TaxID=261450 RepID=A0A835I0X8_9MAGN|nr:hypothetical protein IFM89_010109 [Coptis chinensis]
MSDRVDDLKTWSSAVIALKTTYLDDLLEKPGLQKTMQDELMNATQITFNALAIIDEISQIFSKVNSTEFRVKINKNSRRLLNAEVNKDGYPAWFSVADRRLLTLKKHTCIDTESVVGDGFIASSMGFENVAGPEGEQAVAFHSKSDFSALYNYRMQGYQDTLYYHTCRQFYKNCEISGTVDFIFGEGRTLIQDSHIILREPNPN